MLGAFTEQSYETLKKRFNFKEPNILKVTGRNYWKIPPMKKADGITLALSFLLPDGKPGIFYAHEDNKSPHLEKSPFLMLPVSKFDMEFNKYETLSVEAGFIFLVGSNHWNYTFPSFSRPLPYSDMNYKKRATVISNFLRSMAKQIAMKDSEYEGNPLAVYTICEEIGRKIKNFQY
jgi:hypothetical protein